MQIAGRGRGGEQIGGMEKPPTGPPVGVVQLMAAARSRAAEMRAWRQVAAESAAGGSRSEPSPGATFVHHQQVLGVQQRPQHGDVVSCSAGRGIAGTTLLRDDGAGARAAGIRWQGSSRSATAIWTPAVASSRAAPAPLRSSRLVRPGALVEQERADLGESSMPDGEAMRQRQAETVDDDAARQQAAARVAAERVSFGQR